MNENNSNNLKRKLEVEALPNTNSSESLGNSNRTIKKQNMEEDNNIKKSSGGEVQEKLWYVNGKEKSINMNALLTVENLQEYGIAEDQEDSEKVLKILNSNGIKKFNGLYNWLRMKISKQLQIKKGRGIIQIRILEQDLLQTS